MKKIISLENISKVYKENGKRYPILEHINLDVHEGEFFIFVGPSGCGKSTLLRIMSGLDTKFTGTVTISDSIKEGETSFVFQQFGVFPWLTVEKNIELGLLSLPINKEERHDRVLRELRRLRLEKSAHQYPHELSGGMRQRVGIARALATNPKVIFMDEPFSELDSFTAEELRLELLEIWQTQRPTIVMVTHIVEEAVLLSDRIAVMSALPGKVELIVTNDLPRPRHKRAQDFFDKEDLLYKNIKLQ